MITILPKKEEKIKNFNVFKIIFCKYREKKFVYIPKGFEGLQPKNTVNKLEEFYATREKITGNIDYVQYPFDEPPKQLTPRTDVSKNYAKMGMYIDNVDRRFQEMDAAFARFEKVCDDFDSDLRDDFKRIDRLMNIPELITYETKNIERLEYKSWTDHGSMQTMYSKNRVLPVEEIEKNFNKFAYGAIISVDGKHYKVIRHPDLNYNKTFLPFFLLVQNGFLERYYG